MAIHGYNTSHGTNIFIKILINTCTNAKKIVPLQVVTSKHLKYMKNKLISPIAICALVLTTLLNGCKADVDLTDIDATMSVGTSLALPLGSVRAQLGDFIGENTIEGLYVDEENKYHYSHHIYFDYGVSLYEMLHDVKPVQYDLDIDEKVRQVFPEYANQSNFTIPAGSKFTLDFPINAPLEELKKEIEHYRLDSVVVDYAQFTARTTLTNIDLDWKDIKQMQLSVNNAYHSSKGNIITIPTAGYNYNDVVPFRAEDFHVVFMKDPNAAPSLENHIDSIIMNVHFDIETSRPLVISSNQRVQYELGIDTFEYKAIYGYIKEPILMQDSILDKPIEELWSDWGLLDGMVLPLRKPSISLAIEHALAVPLAVRINELSVADKNGTRKYASFDDQQSKNIYFPSKIAMNSPYSTTAIDTLLLDYTAEHGNIDELFTIHPDFVTYNLSVGIDSSSTQQQYRITNNTQLNMDLGIDIPVEFNENVHLAFSDTIHDIDLTTLQLDSLLAELEFVEKVERAELKLLLGISNWIPFNINGTFTFYNENYELVQLSSMESESLVLSIDCPTDIDSANGIVLSPKENTITLSVVKEDFNLLASVKHIVFTASLGDNEYPVALTPNAALQIYAGIDTEIKAIIDIANLF